ncbi:MAG: DUF1648 domain-containing protein [Cyclobacteriaceae bacterium]|nr:DUF1648 domain-containing protein [Cyclobacteriaceae bacterium]
MKRPKLKIEMTRLDWAIEAIAFMIWAGTILFLILNFRRTPEEIPTHYGTSGVPDAFGSKDTLWLLAGISTLLYALLTWIANYPHWYNYTVEITPENAERQYTIAVRMMRILKIVIMIIFAYIHFSSMIGSYLGVWFLPATSLVLVAIIGFYLYKANTKANNVSH